MSSQTNIDNLFRLRKPLVKRPKPTKGGADGGQSARKATESTPSAKAGASTSPASNVPSDVAIATPVKATPVRTTGIPTPTPTSSTPTRSRNTRSRSASTPSATPTILKSSRSEGKTLPLTRVTATPTQSTLTPALRSGNRRRGGSVGGNRVETPSSRPHKGGRAGLTPVRSSQRKVQGTLQKSGKSGKVELASPRQLRLAKRALQKGQAIPSPSAASFSGNQKTRATPSLINNVSSAVATSGPTTTLDDGSQTVASSSPMSGRKFSALTPRTRRTLHRACKTVTALGASTISPPHSPKVVPQPPSLSTATSRGDVPSAAQQPPPQPSLELPLPTTPPQMAVASSPVLSPVSNPGSPFARPVATRLLDRYEDEDGSNRDGGTASLGGPTESVGRTTGEGEGEEEEDEDDRCEVRHERRVNPGSDPLLGEIMSFADGFVTF